MPDADAVARALARLASGAPPRHESETQPVDDGPARVVADAEAATASLHRAARFVDGGGETELRRAVRVAQAEGTNELAVRGRAVLSILESFREAAGQ